MDLDTATNILRHPETSNMHESAAAAAYIHSFYSYERPDLLRPVHRTRDAKPRAVLRDEVVGNPKVGVDGGFSVGVQGAVGSEETVQTARPQKVMRLDPFTQYGLLADTDGSSGGWLVKHSSVSGTGQGMNEPMTAGRLTADQLTKQRHRLEDAAMARMRPIAAAYRTFWGNGGRAA
jgi:hypothetical protein